MSRYQDIKAKLRQKPRRWLVTGAAGFIGSHLTETLLRLNQYVVALDNFSTGKQTNLDAVKDAVGDALWSNCKFIEGDITDAATCAYACQGVEHVLHQAALGSVPRSIDDPLTSHHNNVTGMITMLAAARDAGVNRFVYASSSAVYGDEPKLPKVEDRIGNPLSPYAATKVVNETYARTFALAYGLESIGLRYFNVFGPRQDPEGAYAAVIPKWASSMLLGEPIHINGTGETSRDFCYIENVVQANLRAATTSNEHAVNQVYNVALHGQTSLNELFATIRELLQQADPSLHVNEPVHRRFRDGDIMHSVADIRKAKTLLGFEPSHNLREGLGSAIDWYRANLVAEV